MSLQADVPDVVPWISSAAVVVVPLQYGSGVQNKVIEAMAAGRWSPRGLAQRAWMWCLEQHVVIADGVDHFAAACRGGLLADPALGQAIGGQAREQARSYRYERLALDVKELVNGKDQ